MINNLRLPGWFEQPGAYVLVDGQYGSTGKGLLAGVLAEYGQNRITHVTTNAGPNSGHTAYFDFWGTAKKEPALGEQGHLRVMTQQIPVASVFLKRLEAQALTLLNAGAVIDPDILNDERGTYGLTGDDILIHPAAAIITQQDRYDDQQVVRGISGTGKGIGPAIARKAMRASALSVHDVYRPMLPAGFPAELGWDRFWDWNKDVVFVETAQGFSLGLNTSRFTPFVTSRECTVMQAIADARIPAQMVRKVVMCVRTFPIRVGSVENSSSGGCYEDQVETTWEAIGQKPELTTVTKRVRRVFTWSRLQFKDGVAANRPDVIFLNFANYLDNRMLAALIDDIVEDYVPIMGKAPVILVGHGPHSVDVTQVM